MNDWKKQLKELNLKSDNEINENFLKWIDTHSHYDSGKFNYDRDKLLKNMQKELEAIITLGTNSFYNKKTLDLIQKYDYLYGMVGFFPNETWELDKDFNPEADELIKIFKEQLTNKKIVGLGEIGIDYHWNSFGKRGFEIKGTEAKKLQEKWFIYQLDLAKEFNLPVSMHSREAEEDTIKIFNDYKEINGVMHCFSYGIDSLKIYLDKGLYIGVGGTVTYPNNKNLVEAIKYCPIDRILLETDAPYLTPQAVRRERNDSTKIKYVIKFLSDLKGISQEEIIEITNKNAKDLFKKIP